MLSIRKTSKRSMKFCYREHVQQIYIDAIQVLEGNHKVDNSKLIRNVNDHVKLNCYQSMDIYKNKYLNLDLRRLNSILHSLLNQESRNRRSNYLLVREWLSLTNLS